MNRTPALLFAGAHLRCTRKPLCRGVLQMVSLLSLTVAMANCHAWAQMVLAGLVPHAVAASQPLNKLADAVRLSLAIGLPLRNQASLDALLVALADPGSPRYQHYLTADQFAARFGPTEHDYQELERFARENGLEITGTHANRMILDVTAPVADIERVLHVRIMNYQHPVRGNFFAPDRDPSPAIAIPLLDISGLDNYEVPRPMSLHRAPMEQVQSYVTGSGPSGYFLGKDFRAAYAPGVALTGSGQVVGLLEFDGFYPADEQKNAAAAAMSAVPTQTVLLDGFTGAPGSENIEVMLDIMMATYMAPGLAKIIVYEGYSPNDILNRMATDNVASQLSSSWGFAINATTEQIFKQYAAQGQSMLQASGDSGAYTAGVAPPGDDPNLTVVGGTSLTTAGAGGPWSAESAWSGSGGGVSTVYPLPSYQQGLSMGASHGSTTMRNIPDLALTAALQMYLIQNNGQAVVVGGTSAAAPLWAGFIALANQQSAAHARPRLGFLNPLLYGIGNRNNYTSDLNDIKTGNNGGFPAVTGYDLSTGWGTPAGQHLIDDLTGVSGEPAFQLTGASPLVTLGPSQTGADALTVTGTNGFSGNVTLSLTGLPAGLMASFNPPATATTSTLTLSATAGAPGGTYPVTITGISGGLSSSTMLLANLVVPTFRLSPPAALTVQRGGYTSGTVSIIGQNGFNGSVLLSVAGLPGGVTAAFSPPSSTSSSVLTLSAGNTVPAGSHNIQVTGVCGTLSSTTMLALTVPPPGFTVSVAPAVLGLQAGSKATATVSLSAKNGFNNSVVLSATGLPKGAAVSFTPFTSGKTSIATFTASATTAAGSYPVTVTGTSGTLKSGAAVTLTLLAARHSTPR